MNWRLHDNGGIVSRDLTRTSDDVLVIEAKLGNNLALTALLKRLTPQIWNSIWCITGNQQDTEDAFQDACLKCFLHVNDFDGRSKFSTWFTRIAINSALMNMRKRRVHCETPFEVSACDPGDRSWDIADHSIDTVGHYERAETSRLLRSATTRLRPSLRRIVEIQVRLDASPAEVAKVAGLSLSATKSRLVRARAALRRYLDHAHGRDESELSRRHCTGSETVRSRKSNRRGNGLKQGASARSGIRPGMNVELI